MNGDQFIRAARKWARKNDRLFTEEDRSRGKGGHVIVRSGDKWTTVKSGEIKPPLHRAMLQQLGWPIDAF